MDTNPMSPVPTTGTWFSHVGHEPYQLTSGLAYDQALELATSWATTGLEEPTVEVEVDVTASGDEWVIDVVAHERSYPFTHLGARRARIDAQGQLVA